MGELPDQPFMRAAANVSREPSLLIFCTAAKVLCGWLLHSKTYLIRFVHLSEAVMCPACLRGLDR
jgi:hypothetical protein